MKKRPFRFKYTLYRVQQNLAITNREAKALWVLLALFLVGVMISEVQKRRPAIEENFYAETDSLFLQATEAMRKREATFDSLSTATDTSAAGSLDTDALITFLTPTFPININTAPHTALEALPRIGPKMAERIVNYRDKNGLFRKKSDLLNVKGIGEKTFEQLEDKISIH